MHPEKLSRFSVMMDWIGLLTLALWSDEFHALATYSQYPLDKMEAILPLD